MFVDLVDIDKLESYNKEELDKQVIDKEAKKAKFRLLGPLSKAHNIVVYIRGIDAYVEHFRKLAGRIILIDNRIRWNS